MRIRIRMFLALPDPLVTNSQVRTRIRPSSSKNSKKSIDLYCFVTSIWLFICEEWCKYTSVPNPHPDPHVIRCQRYGSEDPDPYHTDLQHCYSSPRSLILRPCVAHSIFSPRKMCQIVSLWNLISFLLLTVLSLLMNQMFIVLDRFGLRKYLKGQSTCHRRNFIHFLARPIVPFQRLHWLSVYLFC